MPFGARRMQFNEFCEETGFDGFAEWYRSRRMRRFWEAMMVAYVVMVIIEIYYVMNEYIEKPFTTSVEMNQKFKMTIPEIHVRLYGIDSFTPIYPVIGGSACRALPQYGWLA